MNEETNAQPPDDVDEMSFEAAFDALGEVVAKLEAGGLSLDDSLFLHARGVALSGRCGALLEAAELRIREVDAEGAVVGEVDVSGA
jgi:exodeoxyribonuclease VII small subunit